jgi:hypothetical protein
MQNGGTADFALYPHPLLLAKLRLWMNLAIYARFDLYITMNRIIFHMIKFIQQNKETEALHISICC